MGSSGDPMAAEINIDVKLDIKLKLIDIIKLRLAGIKGKQMIDEFYKRIQAPTCVLVNDLAKREGVHEIWIDPYKAFRISVQNEETAEWEDLDMPWNNGAARILVVID